MADEREALEAIRELNGTKLSGSLINVEVSGCVAEVECVRAL